MWLKYRILVGKKVKEKVRIMSEDYVVGVLDISFKVGGGRFIFNLVNSGKIIKIS